MSKAGVTVTPNGETPSRYFNVVEKFYKHISDPRFEGNTRFLDHVYFSVATDSGLGSSCVVRDENVSRLRLRIDSPIGAIEEDFEVRVTGGRLLLTRQV